MISLRTIWNSDLFLYLIVIILRICPDTSGQKPKMIPLKDELLIEEGSELRIECQREQTRLHFSFPEYKVASPRSPHEILPPENKNGTWTFLRRNAVSLDTGWYACAAEGVEIENHFKILNHTQRDIAWIYVYVSSSELFADRYYTFPKTIIILAGSPGIVPCRPTSPDLVVELWKNFRIADSDEQDSFDSKIGFIVKPPSPEDPRSIFQCKINGTEDEYLLFYFNATRHKPKINVIGDELVLREGEELRIECYGGTDIEFGFLSNHDINNYWIEPSKHKMIRNGKGKATLQKREVVLGDMGWYGCAEVGIDFHTSLSYMDYTRQEIHWIYVYVETEERQLLPHNSLATVSARSISLLVPCRPTSPYVNVSLEFESKILALDENVQFDPRLGFLVRQRPHLDIFNLTCITPGDNTEHRIQIRQVDETNGKPEIYSGGSILLTGEDLVLNCIDLSYFSVFLEWNTPTIEPKKRIEFKRNWVFQDSRIGLMLFETSLTIRNVTVNDQGEYSCTLRSAQREEKSDPINIDIYDRHSIGPVVIDGSDDANTFVGLLGQTVRWMLNYNRVFLSPKNIDWFNPLQSSIRLAVKLNTNKYSLLSQDQARMVLEIRNLTFEDAGLYTVRHPYNMFLRARVTLYVQASPSIFILNESDPYFAVPGDVFRIHSRITASPKSNITWTFTTYPNFPSDEDSSFMILVDHNELFLNNYTWISKLTMNTSVSGILTCTACNSLNCSQNSKRIFLRLVREGHNMNLLPMITAPVVILIFILAAWLVIRKRRAKNLKLRVKEDILTRFNGGALDHLDPNLDVADQAEILPYDEDWEYPRDKLQLGKVLGSGAFGIVRKAEAKSIRPSEPFTTVAVKMVRATSTLHHMMALSRELKVLVHLGQHPNIVNLLGACTKNVSYGELFVIVEFCRFGNMQDYLSRRRANFIDKVDPITGEINAPELSTDDIRINDNDTNVDFDGISVTEGRRRSEDYTGPSGEEIPCQVPVERCLRSTYEGDYTDSTLKPMSTRDLLCWAWQVSRGMRYLGVRKVVHGDLAARNILLADNNVIKICDFGLAKALYNDDYYNKEGGDPLPIKWMAIEAIKDLRFSIESDVWSFGIVLWEFFTLAESPYPGTHPKYLYQKLRDGYRMDKPKYAPKTIYRIMMNCWEAEPSKRPSFELIETLIHELLDDSVKTYYLDASNQYCTYMKSEKKDYLTMNLLQKETGLHSVEQERVELAMSNLLPDESNLEPSSLATNETMN